MFTVTSAEIRWFMKGHIPDSTFNWFISLNNNYINQPERIDFYLPLKPDDTLGIKLREGKIEIKKRISHNGNISPGNNVSGVAEKWQKWSFGLKEANQAFPDFAASNKWIPVSKTRILVNYGITEENIVTQKEEIVYQNGCLTELTSIRINNENWWTFGLEAYGEENRLMDNLVLISHLLLRDKSKVRFTLEDSLSYPGLINKL